MHNGCMATERDVIDERMIETLRALVAAIGALTDAVEKIPAPKPTTLPPPKRGGR
jgi:hypothetical protein